MRVKTLLLASTVAVSIAAAQVAKLPPIKFSDTRLDNGLRILIAEDHDAPVYSIAVSYNVGSRNERPGRTGFAHLFEHMMFKGSDKVGPGEHFFLVFNNGGNMNGTTNNDRTNYFETLPKNQLDLGLFLESDRMRSLAITKENLDNQRNAVQEERRLGVDNRPYGKSYERFEELLYDNFVYKHSVIGSMEDLNAASVDDVKEFFKTYYAPNNAVLSIVGDVDTKETLAKIKKYFGDIPRQQPPPALDYTELERTEERREVLNDKLARVPMILLGYRLADGNHNDTFAASVLSNVLGQGESSRLYQRLVKEKELATNVGVFVDQRIGPSMLAISVTMRAGKDPKEAQALIDEEIAKLHAEPISAKELLRAHVNARRNAISMRERSLTRAYLMSDYAVLYNDPNRINTMLDRTLAVSAADVQRVAKQYLKKGGRAVVVTMPGAAGAPRAAAAAPKAE